MNENTKELAKMQVNDGAANNGGLSPTRTVSIPSIAEQRKQLQERSFKSKNPRRNSTIIDRQTIEKKSRRTSKTDANNLSLSSSGGSALVEKLKQRTIDSLNDALSNNDCNDKLYIYIYIYTLQFYFVLKSYRTELIPIFFGVVLLLFILC